MRLMVKRLIWCLILASQICIVAASAVAGDLDYALSQAVGAGDMDAIRALIVRGANVNAKVDNGATALMVASESANTAVVRTLLNNGADVDSKDRTGVTALIIASGKGRIDVVQVLLAGGADVNAKSSDGMTAL